MTVLKKRLPITFPIIMIIVEHFGEDFHGREGHDKALISKETLYIAERKM